MRLPSASRCRPSRRQAPGIAAAALAATVALVGSAATLSPPALAGDASDDACVLTRADAISRQRLQQHVDALVGDRSGTAAQAAAAEYIRAQLASYGYTVRLDPVQTSENVVARRDGAVDPDVAFLLGAHFDTVPGSPGADDNATGIAAMLEIARVLADWTPDISVEFIGFALEEVGLVGSTQYAQQLAAADAQLAGMISFDMLGYTCAFPGCQTPIQDIPGCLDFTPTGGTVGNFALIGANANGAALLDSWNAGSALAAPNRPIVSGLLSQACVGQPAFSRSDHAPFQELGYDALVITDSAELRNPNYHRPTDTVPTVNFALVEDVARATLAAILDVVGGHAGDADGDGTGDCADNCPAIANSGQADSDGDQIGDACDACPDDPGETCDACPDDPDDDADDDGVCGDVDNCPATANPGQADSDGDQIGDACDACPDDPDDDADDDGICGDVDNCPATANPGQADFDGDGRGDVCETGADLADIDGSSRVDGIDLVRLGVAFASSCGDPAYDAAADLDRDCTVDGADLALLGARFGEST